MQLDIKEVIEKSGEAKEYPVEFSPETLSVSHTEYPIDKKQPFLLRFQNVEERELLISGETEVTVLLACDRCLKEVPKTFSVKIEKVISIKDGSLAVDPDEDEGLMVEENIIDIDRLVSEEILLDFPTKVLCKEDCRGICPVCGQDLNKGDCGCDRFVQDPRLAQFSEIFNSLSS